MSVNQKNREPGFYWVRTNRWYISEWRDNAWWFPGDNCCQYECDIDEIDERRITRDEQKS